MSSLHSVGAMNQFADGCDVAGITPEMLTRMRDPGFLAQVKMVLVGLATIVRACLKLALDKDFSPASFINERWSTWKGPVDGNGTDGDEDYVPEPDMIDFEQIVAEVHLRKEDGGSVIGEEWMRRSRASKNRQLGGKAFLALWNDWQACKAAGKPEDSVLERLRKSGKIGTIIYFFGQTLRVSGGNRCVLYLCFGGREWDWYYFWLDSHWDAKSPSVALASVETQP